MSTRQPHYHGHRQRLRERLAREPRQLADYEILELLLGLVIRRGDTKPLAKELLARHKTLRGVFLADPAELRDLDGFGDATADFWLLWRETWARLHEAPVADRVVIQGPENVAELAKARLGPYRREEFWVALVDNKNRLLAWERASQGTVDQTIVYPREVFSRALELKASGMVLVHNHPGGDPRPSAQDVELTRRMVRAATDLGMRVLDHIIVTDHAFYSFQQEGML
ncbi:DNA repair protein RadC [Desulfovibrio sp. X2]|uniref:RadC family protein n=1 Tax=Desulfovibrio sp. X2 TaxID=941449 RepID=UPI0003586E6D|nr:DNA repair protein RadC [Desulfovibrio sp. X2]EPR44767.1 DNA repair protein RadC [Desulfovibrio sp. X2]